MLSYDLKLSGYSVLGELFNNIESLTGTQTNVPVDDICLLFKFVPSIDRDEISLDILIKLEQVCGNVKTSGLGHQILNNLITLVKNRIGLY